MGTNSLIISKDLSPALTNQEQGIILAAREPKIKDMKKAEVANKITDLVGMAFVILNQSKMEKEDRVTLQNQIVKDLYEKFQFFTLKEVENAFYLGTRGELKTKPDEIVFMSIAQIYQWLNNYRTNVKRAAMKKQIDFEAKSEEIEIEEKKRLAEEFMKGEVVRSFNDYHSSNGIYDPLAVVYDYLDKKGFVKLSNSRKKEIYNQCFEKYKAEHEGGNTIAEYALNKKILSEIEAGSSRIQAIVKLRAKNKALEIIYNDIKEMGLTIEEYMEDGMDEHT